MMWNKFVLFLKSNKTSPIFLIYIGVFLIGIFFVIDLYRGKQVSHVVLKEIVKENPFEALKLNAKAVYVFDSKENKVLFKNNEALKLPLASITKLMSVYCALQNNDLKKSIVVPDVVFAYNENASSTGRLENWTLENLAIYTLIESSNYGALSLATNMGGETDMVQCMNHKAFEMGLLDTSFFNVTGLDLDPLNAGAYGTAENATTLLQRVYSEYPQILSKTAYTEYEIYSENGKLHKALNTNLAGKGIVGLLASKTGLTDLAGGNLVYVANIGLDHKIYVAILGSTEAGRFEDALIINEAIVRSMSQ